MTLIALIILVDMDGTIADWGKQWDIELDTWFPESKVRRHRDQTSFNLKEGLSPEDAAIVDQVMAADSFYRWLEPIPGAIEALHAMADAGHQVFLVTSPWHANFSCVRDKLDWVHENLGADWVARTIITSDKTLVYGDILIDDKPEIHGAGTPAWEHVLFHQPYNSKVIGKRRLRDWRLWKVLVSPNRSILEPEHNYFFGIDPVQPLVRDIVVEESLNGEVLEDSSKKLTAEFAERSDEREAYIPLSIFSEQARERTQNLINEAVAKLNTKNGVRLDHTALGTSGGLIPTDSIPTGEVRVTSSTGGQKGKKLARYDLIPIDALNQLAEHYGRGAFKYDDNQYRAGYPYSLSYASLLRHAVAWWDGEDFDPELGSHHLAAVAWHAFTLLTFIKEHPEHDDRFKAGA